MEKKRGGWSNNLGFILAAIGSAVGLGNIWGFPYKMGRNGGFAFLIVYVILALLVGLMIMITELALGRKTTQGAVAAYKTAHKGFGWIGWLAVLAPAIIMGFYNVLGGYCVEYLAINLSDIGFGIVSQSGLDGGALFGNMLTSPIGAIIFSLLFIGICFIINRKGISNGIERFNKVAMPALFIMLVIIIIRSCTLPGAEEGLKFMLAPNFEPFKEDFIGVLSQAGGQMFFSLSLAMGIIVTYGSYMRKEENIVKNSLIIVLADTLVAIMAGLAVIPAAYALGGADAAMAGPKLLFVTLQDVFNSMGAVGPIFGVIFYLFVIIAALSSMISLLEVITTFFVDKAVMKDKPFDRKKITAGACIFVGALSILVAADGLGSNGLWVPFQNSVGIIGSLNDCWLDFLDAISEGIMMPIGALFTSIMFGWVVGPKFIKEEVELEGNKFSIYKLYNICMKFIVPVIMLLVLLGKIDEIFALGIF